MTTKELDEPQPIPFELTEKRLRQLEDVYAWLELHPPSLGNRSLKVHHLLTLAQHVPNLIAACRERDALLEVVEAAEAFKLAKDAVDANPRIGGTVKHGELAKARGNAEARLFQVLAQHRESGVSDDS